MSEPTVQVPVSLIGSIDSAYNASSDTLAALIEQLWMLSQPTPTAEPPMCGETLRTKSYTHECVEAAGHTGKHMSVTGIWWTHNTIPAPPSIADMAPGTTFERATRERWTVKRGAITGRLIAESDSDICYLDDIDPSTIRDVTPPAHG